MFVQQLIPSASTNDDEARWAGIDAASPCMVYKAHVAIDQDTGLICGVEVITANAHAVRRVRCRIMLPQISGARLTHEIMAWWEAVAAPELRTNDP